MTDHPRDVWERRADETPKAWAAFQTYRDLDPQDRSLAEVGRRCYGARGVTKAGTAVGRVRDWARRYDWEDRAAAWDAEVDRRRREALIGGALRMAERHARDAEAVSRALMAPVQALLRRIRNAGGDEQALNDLSTEELVRLVRGVGHAIPHVGKMERLARGLPEDVSELRAADGTDDADWLRDLLADPDSAEALDEIAATIGDEDDA